MSRREIDRLGAVQAVQEGRLTQGDVAQQLDSAFDRFRLCRRYRLEGIDGLASKHRGKRPNNATPSEVRQAAVEQVHSRYADFGPTLAHEMLTECHSFSVSVETVRKWMIKDGLWQAQSRRRGSVHQGRERRPCRGELVQIDGSPHDWFEGRSERCTLIVFIDDATSELLALRFFPAETTAAYMTGLHDYRINLKGDSMRKRAKKKLTAPGVSS